MYRMFLTLIAAMKTSRQINSCISGLSSANSGTIDLKTRMMMPQHLESRISITCVQNVMSGSRMTLLDNRSARI